MASRLLQIDLQRLFRRRVHVLRQDAPAESSCIYGYPERMVDAILGFVGRSVRQAQLCLVGVPIWHEEQLHLAEWQALQQLEFVFNLTLSVDAMSMALEKLKAHKQSTSREIDAEELQGHDPIHRLDGEDPGGLAEDDLIPPEESVVDGAVLAPVTDGVVLLRLLDRAHEVALAR